MSLKLHIVGTHPHFSGQTAGMERERKNRVWRFKGTSRQGLSGKTPDYEYIEQRVLVIGVSAAGARTAIELVERGVDPQKILVIGKRAHEDPHITWARGGINGVLGTHDPADDPDSPQRPQLERGLPLVPVRVYRVYQGAVVRVRRTLAI